MTIVSVKGSRGDHAVDAVVLEEEAGRPAEQHHAVAVRLRVELEGEDQEGGLPRAVVPTRRSGVVHQARVLVPAKRRVASATSKARVTRPISGNRK